MELVRSQARPYLVLLILTITCALAFVFVGLANEAGDSPDASTSSFAPAHTTLQLLSISASLSIFGIRWTAGRISRSLPDIFIGVAFLAVGLFHLFSVLSYPGLLEDSRYSSFEISTYFRQIARFVLIFALLALVFLPFRRKADSSDSILIVLGVTVFVLFIFHLVLMQGDILPSIYAEDGSMTTYGRGLCYTCAALFAIGALKYSHLGGIKKETTHFYTAAALATGAFGELSFSIHSLTGDVSHLLAHSLEFTSFLILFLALLRESVAAPFETLSVSRNVHERDQVELELKTKEAEDAKLRAQAHLDFLAHDVSNIISPIVSYSELLLEGENLTPQQRHHLDIILRQAQKGGAFVANLRRLAAADAVPPEAFVGIDLVKALQTMGDFVRSAHRDKAISITQSLPADGQAISPGGDHIENVIYEVLKDAVESAPGNSARISISLKMVKDRSGRNHWQTSITNLGHKFTPETIADAKMIYDPRRGIRRGIASNYTFYSSIVDHFGGRFWIENLPDDDGVPRRRVTIELPAGEASTDMMGGD